MPPTIPPDLNLILLFLRMGQGWSQANLGKAAGVSPNLINDYERGRKSLTRTRLEHLLSFMNLPPERIDATLAVIEANRAASAAPKDSADVLSESRRRIEAVAGRTGKLATELVRSVLSMLTLEAEGLAARERAAALWARLKSRSPEERTALVEDSRRFRTWALMERVALESIAAAAENPAVALKLAQLALRIAELVPGPEGWRLRLAGYAWAHIANAKRVLNDLASAEAALDEAKRLWNAGASSDPGLLNEVWILWIEATIHDARRRFTQALRVLDQALALDEGELRGKLLLTKAQIHTARGDLAQSTAALTEAAALTSSRSDPRMALAVRFQIVVNLCHEERANEAAARMPEVRELSRRIGNEMDFVRTVWLEGLVAAGLGNYEEAEQALDQVRREFAVRNLAYDYAIVSMELASVLLETGRTCEVRAVADSALRTLQAQGVQREPMAALALFLEAAGREEVTLDSTRRLVRYLYRASHDPELPFEAA